MKSKKAFINLDGKVQEKEQPCIEYVDNRYLEESEKQKSRVKTLLSLMKTRESLESGSKAG